MDRTRLASTGLRYERGERAHLILAAPDEQTLAVQTQDADGTVRTIKHLDFGAATGGTVRLDDLATVGDKILVGRDAAAADGTETDAAYRVGYGVIDFEEAGAGAEASFAVSNDVRVNGDVHAAAFVALSDAREKRDVRDVTPAEAALVHAMRPVTYTMRQTGHESAGLIAQELEAVFPRAVRVAHGVKTVDYQQIHTLVLAELQRLARRVGVLESALHGRT